MEPELNGKTTPWSTVLLEKPVVSQPVKKLPGWLLDPALIQMNPAHIFIKKVASAENIER